MPTTLFGRDRNPALANLSLLDNRQADLEQVDDGYRDTRPIPGAGLIVWLVAGVPVLLALLAVVHLVATYGADAWQAAQTALAALASLVGA